MNRVVCLVLLSACRAPEPRAEPFASRIQYAMAETGARGLAIAEVRGGEVNTVRVFGERDASGAPLTSNTVMYGASLTKAAFAYLVLMLVDDGVIDLDASIESYLPKPLPSYEGYTRRYAPYETLSGDERWRKLTPRMLLTHSGGFANFYFLEPDRKLHFHFEPGARYAYSGDGFILLQFVLEEGLGLDVGAEMRRRIFEPFRMARTDLVWREDFANDLADGWT
ncbi:MAG: serine hydrolase domain-containing protein, partial [Myxococcota bacterium]